MNALRPSSPVAWSSSAIASSGVCIGMMPTGVSVSRVVAERLGVERVERARRAARGSTRRRARRARARRSGRGPRGRCRSPGRRAASRSGSSAVPRSSVLRAGSPHHDVRMRPAARICSGVSPRMAAAPPVTRSMTATASSPACSRRMSRTSGRYSMAWPSASMIGWSRRDLDRGDLVAGKELHGAILALAARCSAHGPERPQSPARARRQRGGRDPRRSGPPQRTVARGDGAARARRSTRLPPIPSVGALVADGHSPGVLRRRFGRRPARAPGVAARHVRRCARALAARRCRRWPR